MSMNYSSLVGDKTTVGSIARWTNYSKLDPITIVDEAQSLLYGLLRTREMLADFSFSLAEGNAHIALPTGLLDPIGRIRLISLNVEVRHKDSNYIQSARNYDETSGTLGADPFTTANGSTSVNVELTGHGFRQDSVFNTSGATAFNGVTVAGTFPITAIVDADNFTIDIATLGQVPSGAGAGGGSAAQYVCDNLVDGIPNWWGIWNETIYFDVAFVQQTQGVLQYYRSLPLLSASNPTNFLTNRYPQLMRTACMAAAADFMKDTDEYNKLVTRLSALTQQVNVENDMSMRGMEIDPVIP
jgi:hypothetical protein